jgi:membrane protein implicated in regulation of membrane protease activity
VGAIAGISIGAILVAVVVAAAVWFWRKTRRRTKEDTDDMQAAWQRVEMDAEGKRILELGADAKRNELYSGSTSLRTELAVN